MHGTKQQRRSQLNQSIRPPGHLHGASAVALLRRMIRIIPPSVGVGLPLARYFGKVNLGRFRGRLAAHTVLVASEPSTEHLWRMGVHQEFVEDNGINLAVLASFGKARVKVSVTQMAAIGETANRLEKVGVKVRRQLLDRRTRSDSIIVVAAAIAVRLYYRFLHDLLPQFDSHIGSQQGCFFVALVLAPPTNQQRDNVRTDIHPSPGTLLQENLGRVRRLVPISVRVSPGDQHLVPVKGGWLHVELSEMLVPPRHFVYQRLTTVGNAVAG